MLKDFQQTYNAVVRGRITASKLNDLDQYEGRYDAEDTQMAVLEARRQGLTPFCITTDR